MDKKERVRRLSHDIKSDSAAIEGVLLLMIDNFEGMTKDKIIDLAKQSLERAENISTAIDTLKNEIEY